MRKFFAKLVLKSAAKLDKDRKRFPWVSNPLSADRPSNPLKCKRSADQGRSFPGPPTTLCPQASSTLHLAMFSKLRRRTVSSTPLSHLLTSNDPPSDAKETLVRILRKKIQAIRREITAVKLEIGKYSSYWHLRNATTLEDHDPAIIKNITAHESIISPLRKLPTELLQLIFLQIHWDPQTTSTLPWSLCQVCRSWRTVVHDTPVLWSHITINLNTKPTRLRSQKDRLKLILQRSGNVDLWVWVSGMMNKGDKRLSLLRILVAHSERWRYLDLTMTAETIMIFQDVKGHLPRLRQLRLKFWVPRRITMDIDMFSIAPRLENVAINNDDIYNIRVIIPFHQLSSYSRKNVPDQIGEFNNSLSSFSNLVHLETRWESTDSTVDLLEPRITLPRLEVLVISFTIFITINHPAVAFFERLILPSIKKIVLRNRAQGAVLAISSMVSRSLPCDLRTLSIATEPFAWSGHMTSLLHLTPQLEHLEIPLPPDRDLSNLFDVSKIPTLTPRLQSLSILMLDSSRPSHFLLGPLIAISEIPSNAEGFLLRTLQLKFTTTSACRNGYFAIQPFPLVGELNGEVLALINSWKNTLVKGIPHLSRRPTPRKILVNLMHWRRLDQLFSTIEGYDIPTSGYLHVRDFFSVSS